MDRPTQDWWKRPGWHDPSWVITAGQSGHFGRGFIDGGSVGQHIGGPQPDITKAAWIILSLARALHAAHLQGSVRRDLKPANILLTADGRPKIADFGLARRLGGDTDQTRTG